MEGSIEISKVLVAVDGSEQSNKAVRMASKIAKCMGAEVTLIHVVEIEELPTLIAEAEDKKAEEMGQLVLGESYKLAKLEGIEPKVVLRKGHAGGQIIRYANEYDPNMIFTGTRGRGGTTAMLMGSVSRKVTDGAHVPVVIVR